MNTAFTIFSTGIQIALAIQAAIAQFASGQPVDIPAIKTYIGGKHVQFDIKVTPLP
jgi:hypothetical protein